MDLATFSGQLAELTGLPVTYHHFQKGDSSYTPPVPPFLVYYVDSDNSDLADDTTWYGITGLTVELYTDKKELATEQKVNSFFKSLEINATHTEDWIDEEKMYMQTYTFEIGE